MKKILISTIVALFAINMVAQPVSGFLGKKLMTSLELEVIPGIQNYEVNQSEFLSYGLLTGRGSRSYTPRVFVNADYQLWQNTALSGSIGYARMHVPFFDLYTQGMNTYAVQLRIKGSIGSGKFPTSSTYYATGIGLYFGSMKDALLSKYIGLDTPPIPIGTTDVSASNIALNIELGRRMVFNGGLILDFGLTTSISTGIGGILNYNDSFDFQDVNEDYIKKQMKTRMALNSLFNFKIGIGYFVH